MALIRLARGALQAPSDVYVRSFLCSFNKTLLYKSSWVIKPGPWSWSEIFFFRDHESVTVHHKLSVVRTLYFWKLWSPAVSGRSGFLISSDTSDVTPLMLPLCPNPIRSPGTCCSVCMCLSEPCILDELCVICECAILMYDPLSHKCVWTVLGVF